GQASASSNRSTSSERAGARIGHVALRERLVRAVAVGLRAGSRGGDVVIEVESVFRVVSVLQGSQASEGLRSVSVPYAACALVRQTVDIDPTRERLHRRAEPALAGNARSVLVWILPACDGDELEQRITMAERRVLDPDLADGAAVGLEAAVRLPSICAGCSSTSPDKGVDRRIRYPAEVVAFPVAAHAMTHGLVGAALQLQVGDLVNRLRDGRGDRPVGRNQGASLFRIADPHEP